MGILLTGIYRKINHYIATETPIKLWPFFEPVVLLRNRIQIAKACSASSTPVLVYQMGKVASSTITSSLAPIPNISLFHVHRLHPDNIFRFQQETKARGWHIPRYNDALGICLYNKFIKSGMPLKIISVVREPISRNISAYFQNLDFIWGIRNAHKKIHPDRLIARFMDEYPHELPLKWFDEEFKCVLGIDIFDYVFPRDLGFVQIDTDLYNILIMRSNIKDKIKQKLISAFFGDDISLITKNVSKNKRYYREYKNFKQSIKFTDEFINHMLESKFTTHFYNQANIQQFQKKWLR